MSSSRTAPPPADGLRGAETAHRRRSRGAAELGVATGYPFTTAAVICLPVAAVIAVLLARTPRTGGIVWFGAVLPSDPACRHWCSVARPTWRSRSEVITVRERATAPGAAARAETAITAGQEQSRLPVRTLIRSWNR